MPYTSIVMPLRANCMILETPNTRLCLVKRLPHGRDQIVRLNPYVDDLDNAWVKCREAELQGDAIRGIMYESLLLKAWVSCNRLYNAYCLRKP